MYTAKNKKQKCLCKVHIPFILDDLIIFPDTQAASDPVKSITISHSSAQTNRDPDVTISPQTGFKSARICATSVQLSFS
jgi:hypothetical protein